MRLGLDLGVGQSAPPAASGTAWNPAASGAGWTFSNGNLTAARTSGSGDTMVKATTSRTSGYYEDVPTIAAGSVTVGVATSGNSTADWVGDSATSCGYASSGAVFINAVSQAGPWATYTSSDVIGVCVKASKVYFSKNNVWQGGGDPVAQTGGLDIS